MINSLYTMKDKMEIRYRNWVW